MHAEELPLSFFFFLPTQWDGKRAAQEEKATAGESKKEGEGVVVIVQLADKNGRGRRNGFERK